MGLGISSTRNYPYPEGSEKFSDAVRIISELLSKLFNTLCKSKFSAEDKFHRNMHSNTVDLNNSINYTKNIHNSNKVESNNLKSAVFNTLGLNTLELATGRPISSSFSVLTGTSALPAFYSGNRASQVLSSENSLRDTQSSGISRKEKNINSIDNNNLDLSLNNRLNVAKNNLSTLRE